MDRERDPGLLVEHLFRHQAGRMVARLTRLLGPARVGLAEDTVQEAMVRALQTWPYQGVPDNAAGSSRSITRSNAMIDEYSVPCAPATSASTGPGCTPYATTTGMLSAASDPAGTSIVPAAFCPGMALAGI